MVRCAPLEVRPVAVHNPDLVRTLQERAARALPAQHVQEVAGWCLRHSSSCDWWVGTVLPHGDVAAGELVARVVEAEEFYAGHGGVARFQISPGACPRGLDPFLAERGYRRQGSISLQVASTARVREQMPTASLRMRLDDHPTRAWFETWHAVHDAGGDPRADWDMLSRVDRPSAYARAMIDDEVVAVGRGVVDSGWVGVFGMATLRAARGKGGGRDVLVALAEWAAAHDAQRMYLQVAQDNGAALGLYERSGFSELCGYHYRVATSG